MKVWNYIIIFTTMFIFLEFIGFPLGFASTLQYFGVNIDSASHTLISSDLSSSGFYNFIFGTGGILVALGLGGAVIVGVLTRSFDVNLVLLPLTVSVLIKFVQATWLITKYAMETGENWLVMIVATIFIPLGIGYIFSLAEFFRGTD